MFMMIIPKKNVSLHPRTNKYLRYDYYIRKNIRKNNRQNESSTVE